MPSVATKRRDSIDRALAHHMQAGVVHSYSPPGPGQSQWRITDRAGTHEFTTQQAEAYAVALAAAERWYRNQETEH